MSVRTGGYGEGMIRIRVRIRLRLGLRIKMVLGYSKRILIKAIYMIIDAVRQNESEVAQITFLVFYIVVLGIFDAIFMQGSV